MRALRLLAVLPILAAAAPALAQEVPGFTTTKQFKLERLGENHWRATGQVEMEKEDMRFFADQVDYFPETHRLEATGNVVYVSKENRIAADRLEFDTETRLGTFYNASGTAALTQNVDRSMFGSQEPEAYFYGERLEKVGPDKYRIRKGGFTTCLQPTPRWEITASTVTLTLEEYAVVKNSLLKVKGVPVFYMPIFYYPVQEDDRATGFLIPTYGTSTVRGQSLSNAFFWAIDRSQDATFLHDWFSRTGQGVGGEYRYVAGPGSEGSARTYFLDEKAITYVDSSGNERVQAGRRSYELRGRLAQRLPANLRARANIDYFSDVTVQQTYQSNLYDASLRQRSYGGNVAGSWGATSLSGTYTIRELFYDENDSTVNGSAPRISFARAPRALFGSPVYFSINSEFNRQIKTDKFNNFEQPEGFTRIDVSPAVRYPLSQLPFLAVNTSLTWRNTYYSQRIDENGDRVPEWLTRQFFDMRADLTGPTFTRIFDTNGGYAEKVKHVIEPNFSIQRTTLIDNYAQVPKLESYDYILGGTTRITYGLTNRLLARRRGGTRQSAVREFVTVGIQQSYYTDPRASQVDPSYGTSFLGRGASSLSPWQVGARVSPADNMDATMRFEYDQEAGEFLSMAAGGRYAFRDWFQTHSGWSRRRASARRTDNYMNFGTSFRGLRGRVGGYFGFDYDFVNDRMLQRRIQAFYNAQCCGIAVDLQTYNFPTSNRFFLPRDRRFNVTFTLAGIGTFANVFGVFGNPDSARAR